MPQPCPRKLRLIALAEVLMKLAESCVIEQHIDRLLNGAGPTNLGLCTPHRAAQIVRIVRGWANDMTVAPKCYQLIWKTPTAELFDQRAWKRRGVLAPSLLRDVRHNGNPATRGSGSDATLDC